MSKKDYSPSADLKFNVITPDFIDHVLYKVAVAVRERDVDPRHSVVVMELWEYRLTAIAETMMAFNNQANRLNTAMDVVDMAREQIAVIRDAIEEETDSGALSDLVVRAAEILGSAELAMEGAIDG